jgi:hypothetical protein
VSADLRWYAGGWDQDSVLLRQDHLGRMLPARQEASFWKGSGSPSVVLEAAAVRGSSSVHGLSGENSFTQVEYEGLLAVEAEEMADAAARDLEDLQVCCVF